jgi:hypothetical protein
MQTHDDNARNDGNAVMASNLPPDCCRDLSGKNNVKSAIPSHVSANSMLKFLPPPRLGILHHLWRDEILQTEEMQNGKQEFVLLHRPGCRDFCSGYRVIKRLLRGQH